MPKYPGAAREATRTAQKALVRVEVPARLLLSLDTPPGQYETVGVRSGLPGDDRFWARSMHVRSIRQRTDGMLELRGTQTVRLVAPDATVRVDVPPETAAVWKEQAR